MSFDGNSPYTSRDGMHNAMPDSTDRMIFKSASQNDPPLSQQQTAQVNCLFRINATVQFQLVPHLFSIILTGFTGV